MASYPVMPSPMSTAKKVGIGLAIVGGIATVAGIVILLRSKKKPQGMAGFGNMLIGETRKGGMTSQLFVGPFGLKERVKKIQGQIQKSVQDPTMRKLALQITRGCPERDGMCEARAIYTYVKKRVRYTGDGGPVLLPNGRVEPIDIYQTAKRTLEFGGGDCDDQSTLIGTLGALNGIEMRLRTVMYSPHNGHIYPIAMLPKNNPSKAVVLDTTLPGDRFNVEAPIGGGKVQDFPV